MKKILNRKNLTILFGIYILGLVYVLFLHNSYRLGLKTFGMTMFSAEHLSLCNFIPFYTIGTYINRLIEHTINTDIVIINLSVNLILFAPMGVFLPILFRDKINRFWKFLFSILITTILVEVIQVLTMMGTTDIDDVILNTLGACIVYWIMQIRLIKNFIHNVFKEEL